MSEANWRSQVSRGWSRSIIGAGSSVACTGGQPRQAIRQPAAARRRLTARDTIRTINPYWARLYSSRPDRGEIGVGPARRRLIERHGLRNVVGSQTLG